MVPQLHQIRYYQSYQGILYRHTGLEYPGISYWLRLPRYIGLLAKTTQVLCRDTCVDNPDTFAWVAGLVYQGT